MLHWSTFGQIKHSSCSSILSVGVFKSPLKRAHLAGESKTKGYSVGFMPITLVSLVTILSFDMQ